MKEKDISKILKDADNEMINRISENFPEDDEKRKQRIFEKTAEKYAQKINDGGNSARDISVKIINKESGHMSLKYLSAAAAFVLVFAGVAAGIIFNNKGNHDNTVYDSFQTTYTEFSTDAAVTVQTSCLTAAKTEMINISSETTAVPETSSVTEISKVSDNIPSQNPENSETPVSSENERTETNINSEKESAEITSELTETTPAVTSVTENTESAEHSSVWYWPVSGFTNISGDFWDGRNHGGIDIVHSKAEGMEGKYIFKEPVIAAFSGVASIVSSTCTHNTAGHYNKDGEWTGDTSYCQCGGGYGNYVVVQSSEGVYASYYAHLNEVTVERGKLVNAGDIIGYVGTTGYSTGPHLHFEIRKDGARTNPLNYQYIDFADKEPVTVQIEIEEEE